MSGAVFFPCVLHSVRTQVVGRGVHLEELGHVKELLALFLCRAPLGPRRRTGPYGVQPTESVSCFMTSLYSMNHYFAG